MPFEDASSHLQDILDSIHSIQKFVHGMDREAYCRDEKTQAAVERKLLIISEAAIRLQDSADVFCPGIPWRDIRGSGNWLRHQYDSVDVDIFGTPSRMVCRLSRPQWKKRLRQRKIKAVST